MKWEKEKEPRWLAFTVKGQMGYMPSLNFLLGHMYMLAREGQGFFPILPLLLLRGLSNTSGVPSHMS